LQKEHVDVAIAALDAIFTEYTNKNAVGAASEGETRG